MSYDNDANGNINVIGNKTLTYNQDNRLASVSSGSTTLGIYTYNGLGQRIIKEAGGKTTVFHYDFDGNIIGESDSDTGAFSKEYLYRGSTRLALVDVPAEEVYYYGNDQLGTPQILTDSENNIVWEAIYKPFGEAMINAHPYDLNNFRFPGQYYDSETGLHYNYHRYYDPSTGRYLTPDPIGQLGGINLFAYTFNNPINGTDPEGKSIGIAGGVVVVAVGAYYGYKWYQNVKSASKTGEIIQGLYKEQNNAIRNGDIATAEELQTAIGDLQQKGLSQIADVIASSPAGTFPTGTPITSLEDLAVDDLIRILSDYYTLNQKNKDECEK